MPEQFEITAARKINELKSELEKLTARQGGQMMAPASGITRTVGSGKDFTTIQSAIDWFKGRQFSNSACIIAVDAGTYSEAINISDLDTNDYGDLVIQGDTRNVAGHVFVSGWNTTAWASGTAYVAGDIRRSNLTATIGLWMICTVAGTSGGAEPTWTTPGTITADAGTLRWLVMGIPANPYSYTGLGGGYYLFSSTGASGVLTIYSSTAVDLTAAGVTTSDIALIRQSTGVVTQLAIQSVGTNTITFTTTIPVLGSPGDSFCIMPNRVISSGNNTAATFSSKCMFRGFRLNPNSGYIGVNINNIDCEIYLRGITIYNGTTNGQAIAVNKGRVFSDVPDVSVWRFQYALYLYQFGQADMNYARFISSYSITLVIGVGSVMNLSSCAVVGLPAGSWLAQVVRGGLLNINASHLLFAYAGIVNYAGSVVFGGTIYGITGGGAAIYSEGEGSAACDSSAIAGCLLAVMASNAGYVSAQGTSILFISNTTNYNPAASLTPNAQGAMIWWT